MAKKSKRLTWFGHNCFLFEYESTKFLVDPFLAPSVSPVRASDIKTDYILISHGHSDHCANAVEIAGNSSPTIIGIAEVASFFNRKGLKTESVNIGGALYLPFADAPDKPKFQILTVQAPHSSTMPDGSPGGNSIGFVLSFSQNDTWLSPDKAPIKPMRDLLSDALAFTIYFACDAGYFEEMKWIGRLGVDLAVLPIGDLFTMGPSVSLDAINAINPQCVVPCHYNTWKPIAQDVGKWSDAVRQYTKSLPLPLAPGQTISEVANGVWK